MAREWLLRGVKPEELQRTTAPDQPATPRGKWENYWYHYKWHTLGGIFLVAVLAVMLGHLLVRNTPDYRVLLLTERVYTTQEVDALELLLSPYGEDLDGDGQVEITVTNCMLGEQVKQQYNSNIQMFQANLMAGDVMCFIWDQKTYKQQVPAVEELMQEDNVFLAQLPIEHTGLSEDGCVYNWKGSAQQRILTEMFPKRYPEELLFTVRHPNGTAEGSEELYKQGLALIKRLVAGSDKAPEGYELPTTTAAPTTTTTTTAPRITTGTTAAKKEESTTARQSYPPTEPGHEHKFVSRVIEPDCQEEGYTRYICTCGYTYTDNSTPKIGHRSRWVMEAASTPTEEGLIRHYCEFCGKTLREEVIPKKKKPYNIDSRVKITKAMFTDEPVYEFKKARVIDGRTWGEAPIIEILKDDSLKVTYYTQRGEKVVFTVEQPTRSDRLNRAEISNDGTYTCQEFSSFS